MDIVLFTVGFGLFVLLISNLVLFQQPLWDAGFAPDMSGIDFDHPRNDIGDDPVFDDESFFSQEALEPYMIPANSDDLPPRSDLV